MLARCFAAYFVIRNTKNGNENIKMWSGGLVYTARERERERERERMQMKDEEREKKKKLYKLISERCDPNSMMSSFTTFEIVYLAPSK